MAVLSLRLSYGFRISYLVFKVPTKALLSMDKCQIIAGRIPMKEVLFNHLADATPKQVKTTSYLKLSFIFMTK